MLDWGSIELPPRLRSADAALVLEQILMLFVVWGFGMSSAVLAFIGELGDAGSISKHAGS